VHFFHWNFLIFLPLDPDSQYGSGSTKSLNPDPIRIHNPGLVFILREKEDPDLDQDAEGKVWPLSVIISIRRKWRPTWHFLPHLSVCVWVFVCLCASYYISIFWHSYPTLVLAIYIIEHFTGIFDSNVPMISKF
jgi:hypothetical protein